MKPELSKALLEEFPLTFPKNFHFECGDGWEPIIRFGAEWIENILSTMDVDFKDERPTSAQVKEKFGGLRWYFTTTTSEIDDVVSECEKRAWKTCEECSGGGSAVRVRGRLRTLCHSCFKDAREAK